MKKMMVILTAAVLTAAMTGCGKDAGANGPRQTETADEALESLNDEVNAMIEEERREEEERQQQLEEGYPEGVFPVAGYMCRDLLDEELDMDVDGAILGSFDAGERVFKYKYDEDTKTYTIFYYPDAGPYSYWRYHLEGYLNDAGEFVATYYAHYSRDTLFETVGTITGENMFERFEEEYPEVAGIVLDDIEWVYVIYE